MSSTRQLSGLVLPDIIEEASRSDDGRYAEFRLQPLERGFGHTVGNSIRRILLSSLPGAAVWGFRADGVQHEHQAVEGVVEDVHQVVQNLKHLVVRLAEDYDEAQLELAVHEPGPVRASDITESAGVDFVDPDHVLFHLQEERPEDRPLRADIWVKRGRGFVMAEEHDVPDDMPVDLIRVDSVFNPVTKANFRVQKTRVGQRTDFDRLTVQVTTNGALDPADALGHAAEIAATHLGYFTRFGEEVPQPGAGNGDGAKRGEPGLEPVDDELQELLESPLDEFDGISVRSRNTLEKAKIHTLEDIARKSRDEMLQVDNFGEKSLEEVAEVLADHKLHFGMSLERDEEGNLYVREEPAAGNGTGSEPTEEAGDAA
ncbi:MAG: DNA-directed RNA polymerase subunit alpha [Gemmatimonadota bacterium]